MRALTDWISDHRRTAMYITSVAFVLIGVVMLVSSMGSTGPVTTVADMKKDLHSQLKTEQQGLVDDHVALMKDLGTADLQRIERDRSTGRSLMLSLAGTAGSDLDLGHQQVVLNNRYDFLDAKSPVLTEFLPEWLGVTQASGPQTYTLSSMDLQVTQVKGLTYSYLALGTLTPVQQQGQKSSATTEYVLIQYVTNQDGAVTSMTASRASSATRDAFLAADADEKTTASPSPSAASDSPTTEPTDDTTGEN